MRLFGPLPDFQRTLTRGDDPISDYGNMLARETTVNLGRFGDVESKLSAASCDSFTTGMLLRRQLGIATIML